MGMGAPISVRGTERSNPPPNSMTTPTIGRVNSRVQSFVDVMGDKGNVVHFTKPAGGAATHSMVSGRSAKESEKPPSATGDWTMGQAIDDLLARINQRNLERLLRSFEAEGDRELVALVSARLAERDVASPSAGGSTSRT